MLGWRFLFPFEALEKADMMGLSEVVALDKAKRESIGILDLTAPMNLSYLTMDRDRLVVLLRDGGDV